MIRVDKFLSVIQMEIKKNRVPVLIFLTVLLSYAYFIHFIGLEAWNVNSRLNLTYALSEYGTFRIDPYHQNTGDKVLFEGHYYSDKAPGPSFVAVPIYCVLKWCGVSSEKFMRYGITVLTVGLPSALAVLLFYGILNMLGNMAQWNRAVLTLAYGLGTLAFPFCTVFYGHQLAAACSIAAFFILLRIRVGLWQTRGDAIILSGFLSGFAILSDYPAGIIMVALLAYCFLAIRTRKSIFYWLMGLAIPLGMLMYYNHSCFGSVWRNAYTYHVTYSHHAGFMGIGWPDLKALWGITFSPYRGIFYQSPFLLFAVPGAYFLFFNKRLRPEFYVCLFIVLGFLVFNSGYAFWDGVGSAGPRFLIPCIPFLVLLISGVMEKWPKPVAVLAGLSIVLMLVISATEPRAEWRVSNPLIYFNMFLWVKGHLADNIGLLTGFRGWHSLIPLFFLMAISIALMWRWTPRHERTGWPGGQIRKSAGLLVVIVLWIFIAGWEAPSLREFNKAESLFRYYRGQGHVRWGELEKRYAKVIALEPRFMEAHRRLTDVARYWRMERVSEAIKQWEERKNATGSIPEIKKLD